ncbi:Gfo/Idh/MocA family protein [Ulvibacterium sp.]|uniref:Gfo/Idh/MocA family protein n=1 Tax=Ulvibacterium sp. TaxID=2665914 RepID=UPI003BA9ED21
MSSVFRKCLGLLLLVAICSSIQAYDKTMELKKVEKTKKPLRIGVVGLVHTHVHWILGREKLGDIEIVGIVEPNRELAQRYADQHGYSMDIVFDSLDEMVKTVQPEAVTAFNSIYDHLETVRYCAPLGIHVMVEKPLAVSWEHAQEMISLAKKHKIHLLTNYETSWYGSNHKAYDLVHSEDKIGNIRRMVFHTGHFGPIEIGCNPEFLEWLTDPVLNGGGALTDFGCYGANLATWFMQGQEPESVTCITQQLKPHLYPKVDDDATIILDYPENQVIIQASWNWPHHVKDMEIYGTTGYVICKNANAMKIMTGRKQESVSFEADPLPQGVHDPFALLQKVVQENYQLSVYDVSSLENNERVMQILEAAKRSAETHKTVIWKDMFPETASNK